MDNWQIKAGRGGVCDFKGRYEFYFKWLTNKVMSCFVITDLAPEERTKTINWEYAKLNLILDGEICITDFNGKLYACIGSRGGEPDEYYIPKRFLIANPILGSKEVEIDKNGVVIYNTKIDTFLYAGTSCIFATGLYDLISQTATLLADNIISINCAQINARIEVFFTADSEAQAVAGEAILKKMYAGAPYQILRSDLLEKLNVNPVNTSATGKNITELVELHNYIIANFFQSIGIKSNNIMKRERLIRDEIESQDDFLQVSILEILSSWQQGLDKVNEMYGTQFKVELNPVLINELMQQLEPEPDGEGEPEPDGEGEPEPDGEGEPEPDGEGEPEPDGEGEPEPDGEGEPEPDGEGEPEQDGETVIDNIEEQEKTIEAVVDLINGSEEKKEGDVDEPESEAEEPNED